MKKFFAILLAMLLVLSMGAFALADETETPTTTVATLGKVVVISGDGAVMPAETFKFSIANASVSDAAEGVTTATMPTPTLGDAKFDEGANGSEVAIPINLPAYKSVGIYTYTITEIAGNTAGMTYSAATLTLKVTVQNDGNGGFEIAGTSLEGNADKKKHDTFENKYEAGKLTVSKTVTGALGDKTKLFDFSVTFTAPAGKTAKSTISYVDGTETKTLTFDNNGKATATFQLKDAASITFTNIPAGVTYTVTETPVEGYETDKTGDTGTIAGNTTSTAAFTNTKGGTIDTGITTDTLPYAVLLGLVVLAGAALLLKRRMGTND